MNNDNNNNNNNNNNYRVAGNGFKFSISKITCVHFHKQRILTASSLHLDGQAIPVKDRMNFLGLVPCPPPPPKKKKKMPSIEILKKKCQKALNILGIVVHTDWRTD